MDPLNRIENKIDLIKEDISEIKVTLGSQHVVLVEHHSRSTKLEDIVLPIQKKVAMVEGIFKFLAFVIMILGAIKLFL